MRNTMMASLLVAGAAFAGSALAEEPGTRDRLPPSESVATDVKPTHPSTADPDSGEMIKGPNAYGEPSTEPGKKRLGNSETPGKQNARQ